MQQKTRKTLHAAAAVFFAIQMPIAVWLFVTDRKLFTDVAILYLCLVSIYALVATHLAGISSEIPPEQDE